MTNYCSLSAEPKQSQALTACALAEIDALLPTFAEHFRAEMHPYHVLTRKESA
jgi:hypothetical protein